MSYLRNTIGRLKGHRKNGYPNDVLAPDGVAEYGWRLVRKGGIIKFVGSTWQSDLLLPYVGYYVTVQVTCVYCVAVKVFTEYPSGDWQNTFICKIGNDK